MDHKSAAEHFMMAVQEGMDRGVLDPSDQAYLMGMVPKMKEAVDSEYNDGADDAAGEVVGEFEEWLQGLYDEGGESAEVAQRLAMELCMLESEAHRMNDPDGDHDDNECHSDHDGGMHDGGPGTHGGPGDHDGNDHGGNHGPMDGPMGPNFDEANCMALEAGSPVFWVDHNQNGVKDTGPDYEGPYATYHEYEDGSPVQCGPQGGMHDGGTHGGPGGPGGQGGPGGPGGPDGPSQAVVQAWMSGAQPGGGFNFDAAFDAAESTAKAEAQAEGNYVGDDAWNECADAGRDAMEDARNDQKSPQEVFQAISQAVNACGQAQQEAYQD